jgi:hypothetical protein
MFWVALLRDDDMWENAYYIIHVRILLCRMALHYCMTYSLIHHYFWDSTSLSIIYVCISIPAQ